MMDMTPEERDRLTRLETKVDYIIEHMEKLPISPETKERIKIIEDNVKDANQKIDTFMSKMNEKIAYVSGAIGIIVAGAAYAVNWIFSHIKLGWGS